MGPRGLGPKTIKLLKSLKIMKTLFFSTWKRCASRFCEGSTERQLQIIDMELVGANRVFFICEKSIKNIKIGIILGPSRVLDH